MINTEIFYFSGTGNTLALAKKLAAKLGDTKVSLITALRGQLVKVTTPAIGIVFPVYAFGLPRIVLRFVEQLELPPNSYIFALCNSGGMPGNPFKQLQRLLKAKNIQLACALAVTMPPNYLPFGGPGTQAEQHELFVLSDKELDKIAMMIQQQKYEKIERESRIPCFLSNFAHKLFLSRTGKAARKFYANEHCNACGICVRVCPTNNIRLADHGRPVWGEDCEQCMACIQWCPEKAIQIRRVPESYPRYHHPEVSVSEMFVCHDSLKSEEEAL